ncbi:MAG: hypothetical protein QM689_12715 [Oscillospiraceae bacterium]
MDEMDGLIEKVKNYLSITWTDSQTDAKLTDSITRGKAYLNRIVGTQLDYAAEQPRELLFAYVLYDSSYALDDFATNYQHELLSLQMYTVVPDETEDE